MSDLPVAVVGGGISGLSAAWELAQRRVPFVLIERSPRLGGVIRTEQIGPFTIDAGPDAILIHKPAAVALCAELGLAARLVPPRPPRTAYVVRNGTLHPLPAGSTLGIPAGPGPLFAGRLLSRRGRARMALDLVLPRGRPRGDETVAAFFRRRFGAEATAWLAEPLLGGIHAGDVERLSLGALFPPLADAERTDRSVMRGLRRRAAARQRTAGGRDGPFRSFPDGLETLPRALAARLPAQAIRRGVAVTALSAGPPYRIRTSDGASIAAGQVICALPAPAAAPVVAGVDPALGDLCAAIPHTSIAVVVLAFPRGAVRHPLAGSGVVVPRLEPDLSITAATWISSKWSDRAPRDQVLLRGFLGGARDRDALAQPDAALTAAVRRDLDRLLGITGAPTLTRVYRWPQANPQWHAGHRDRIAALDARLAARPGLRIVGAAFRGIGIADCVAAGRAAGRAAADAGQAAS